MLNHFSLSYVWIKKIGIQKKGMVIFILFFLVTLQPQIALADNQTLYINQIILPSTGKVTVNFISTSASCTGDFGLHSPETLEIYPDYLYYRGFPYTLPDVYEQNTELIFYITPGSFCTDGTYLSTDPNRAHIVQQDVNTWLIYWEDYNDGDFNDLVVQIDLQEESNTFLDLPFDYSDSTFLLESRDTEDLGTVNSYVDHEYPTCDEELNEGGCSPTDFNAVNFYGYKGDLPEFPTPYNIAYNGHDGIDFSLEYNRPVLAAASGTVISAGIETSTCFDGTEKDANVIKILHDNGYTTEYWHLDHFAEDLMVGSGVTRDPLNPIGYVGNTGCSTGNHLHFEVHNPSGIVVDPYSWIPQPDAKFFGEQDPWQAYGQEHDFEATSYYLWLHPLITSVLLDTTNTTILQSPSGNVVATFPLGVYNAPLQLELTEILQSANIPEHQSLYSFSLYGYDRYNQVVTSLLIDATIEAQIPMDNQAVELIGLEELVEAGVSPSLFAWIPETATWQELGTSWDPETNTTHVYTNQLGTFALSIDDFSKISPSDGKDIKKSRIDLEWETVEYAINYEYCIDNVDDNICTNPSKWINVGTDNSVILKGLKKGETYYWQVRATTNFGLNAYANDGDWWEFTMPERPSRTTIGSINE